MVNCTDFDEAATVKAGRGRFNMPAPTQQMIDDAAPLLSVLRGQMRAYAEQASKAMKERIAENIAAQAVAARLRTVDGVDQNGDAVTVVQVRPVAEKPFAYVAVLGCEPGEWTCKPTLRGLVKACRKSYLDCRFEMMAYFPTGSRRVSPEHWRDKPLAEIPLHWWGEPLD